MNMPLSGKHILIIVENLPVPFDRRVWQEANTLSESGAHVSIICPQMKGYTRHYEVVNGIEIYRHPLPLEARVAIGYLAEYGAAIYWEIKLAKQIYRKLPFQVIHGCNPPDLIFLTAMLFKKRGVEYVFDHHDINPELYLAKFNKKGLFYKIVCFLEKMTFKYSIASIATNESYKQIAIKRGGMRPENVRVVRSGPKLERLKLMPPNNKYLNGRKYLVGYLGVIGKQEGIELLLQSIKHILDKRQDIQFAIVGGGSDLALYQQMSIDHKLGDYVDFYGRVSDRVLLEVLNSADVCVNPDKPTEMNNLSTMNKIMEYMALKKPIVQYELKEGRYSAQRASLYAKNNDTLDFANKIIQLISDKPEREKMGEFGYQRVVNELSWDHESKKLIKFYKDLVFKINIS
jgi:glycosyltransferase involved in cell wall biosynthesis